MEAIKLKEEFDKHTRSRQCERPSREMLYELFVEGYKLGLNQSEKPKLNAKKKFMKD